MIRFAVKRLVGLGNPYDALDEADPGRDERPGKQEIHDDRTGTRKSPHVLVNSLGASPNVARRPASGRGVYDSPHRP